MNWYPFYVGDYLRDTPDLSLLEHGVYFYLLSTYYGTERPLPAKADAIYRICRAITPEEQEAVGAVLERFWTLTADGWVQRRAADEIAKSQEKAARNRVNGLRGGRPPKGKEASK